MERIRWAWATVADPGHKDREEAIVVLECVIGAMFGFGVLGKQRGFMQGGEVTR
jgi:hypothetical protein